MIRTISTLLLVSLLLTPAQVLALDLYAANGLRREAASDSTAQSDDDPAYLLDQNPALNDSSRQLAQGVLLLLIGGTVAIAGPLLTKERDGFKRKISKPGIAYAILGGVVALIGLNKIAKAGQ